MSDILEKVYKDLNDKIKLNKSNIKTTRIRTERSEIAGSLIPKLLSEAPLMADSSSDGNILFISDGRKSGEGAGSGTGVPAYFNEDTNTWKRFSDDTDVTV